VPFLVPVPARKQYYWCRIFALHGKQIDRPRPLDFRPGKCALSLEVQRPFPGSCGPILILLCALLNERNVGGCTSKEVCVANSAPSARCHGFLSRDCRHGAGVLPVAHARARFPQARCFHISHISHMKWGLWERVKDTARSALSAIER